MTDNGSDWIKQANEMAALSLWHSYCDKKMELEDANDRIEQLTSGPGGIMEMKQTIADKEKRIEQLKFLVHFIANDYLELSYEKAKWQRDDWHKRCRKLIQQLESGDD